MLTGPGENAVPAVSPGPRARVTIASVRGRRGAIVVRLRATAPGSVAVSAPGAQSRTHTARAPGSFSLILPLTKRTRARLARAHRLRLTVTAALSGPGARPVSVKASVTVKG
jgi:hypothetical protein